jgi:hypothetical protein
LANLKLQHEHIPKASKKRVFSEIRAEFPSLLLCKGYLWSRDKTSSKPAATNASQVPAVFPLVQPMVDKPENQRGQHCRIFTYGGNF